jgi:two-component system cell cycle sensor histidine kinase/response regulator CckA
VASAAVASLTPVHSCLGALRLADRLRELSPTLPVLFMSGYTDDEMVRRGLIEPDKPFVSKPFTPEILSAKVRLLLDQASGERR